MRTRSGAQQRALVIDILGACGLAALLLVLASGLGVVAFIAVPLLAVLVLTLAVERLMRRRRHGRSRRPPARVA